MKKENKASDQRIISDVSTVETKQIGTKDPDLLGSSLAILEMMTRECFIIVRETWGSDRIGQIQEIVRDKITECLAQLIALIAKSHNTASAPDDTRVFVATNFRGLRGGLRATSDEGMPNIASRDLLPRDYSRYMRIYGRLGERGKLASMEDSDGCHFFMPVAFWAYAMYEQPLRWSQNHSEPIKIGGFSKWTADYGMMLVSAADEKFPLYGFHFSRGDQVVPFMWDIASGLIHIKFAKSTRPQAVNGIFNQAMRILHDQCGVLFSKGELSELQVAWPESPLLQSSIQNDILGQNDKGFQPLPVITPEIQREQLYELAERVFSTFFYSNFDDPAVKDDQWKQEFMELIEKLRINNEERAAKAAEDLLNEYCENSHLAGSTNTLIFKHYYAFLLNPGLSFRSEWLKDQKDAALGTVNFYTNVELPLQIVAIIRQHLESVCHLIRDIEEWDDGRLAMLRDVSLTLGHEIGKVYNGAAVALNRALKTEKFGDLSSRKVLAFNATRAAMCYGLLWTQASTNNLLPVANDFDDYARKMTNLAWQLCLVANVVRESGAYRATDKEVDTLNQLWVFEAGNILLHVDVASENVKSSVWRIISQHKVAISQWYLAATVNALGHLIPKTGTLSESIAVVDDWLRGTKIPIFDFKAEILGDQLCLAIVNNYDGKAEEPKRHKSTGLALEMASLELWQQLKDKYPGHGVKQPQVCFLGNQEECKWSTKLIFECPSIFGTKEFKT